MILDLHTHSRLHNPQAVANLYPTDVITDADRPYSVGLHPWHIDDTFADKLQSVRDLAALPQVVAVGETGIDIERGGLLFRQMQIFKSHVEISEETGKPLIIHCVKAHDIIASLRRELRPSQEWVIHGFRGKPTVAKILIDSGCSLSFGAKFNPAAVKSLPSERIFAETDEFEGDIRDVIALIEGVRPDEDMLATIAANTLRLFGKNLFP